MRRMRTKGLIGAALLSVALVASAGHAFIVCRSGPCLAKVKGGTKAIVGATPSAVATPPVTTPTTARAGMTLTFAQEFNGTTLDLSQWTNGYPYTNATINNELQAYMPDAFEQLPSGALRIKGEQRALQGKNYTSGVLTTYTSFNQTYGYFEMRAKLPPGKGMWPAFWMLSQDLSYPPELDIMENIGMEPHTIHTTYHWEDNGHQNSTFAAVNNAVDYTAGYHTYAVEWRPQLLIWYVDGTEVYRYAGNKVPSKPMYMQVNLAIGGAWPGSPDVNTPFPAAFDIDYVRAYQIDALASTAATAPRPVIAWGITSVDKPSYAANDMVTVSSQLKTGDNPTPATFVNFQVCDFYETTCSGQTGTYIPALPARTTHPFSVQLPMPALAANPGVYPIRTQLMLNGTSYQLEHISYLVRGN